MSEVLDKQTLDQLFFEARTHIDWQDKNVSDDQLKKLYDLAKWGPTGMNCCPMRLTFVKSQEAKAKLLEAVNGGNIEQTKTAPITAIVSVDEKFYEYMPDLFPSYPEARDMYAESPDVAMATASKNASIQIGYLIMAARAIGLDCGPMGGFDKDKVNELFLSGTTNKASLLVNLGYGNKEKLYPRGIRLPFADVADII